MQEVAAAGTMRFRIKLAARVTTGAVGAGVLTKERTHFYTYEMTSSSQGATWQLLEISTPCLADCGALVINNASPHGSSRAEIRLVGITEEARPKVPLNSGSLRTVHVVDAHSPMKELYYDRIARWVHPNLTFVTSTGAVVFETNEIGLKGDPIDPNRRLAVVWGDSVVFGIGRSWPCLLDDFFPGYQFLNGGVEGESYFSVLDRAAALNTDREIGLNVLMLGWHPEGYNQHLRSDLVTALPSITNPVLVTMPTALNRHIVDKDISSYLAPGDADAFAPEQGKVGFYFYGGLEYSLERQRLAYRYMAERNEIIRQVAAEKSVPLIDLFAMLSTEQSPDFREDFFDILHPRPRAYGKIAHTIAEGLKGVMSLQPR